MTLVLFFVTFFLQKLVFPSNWSGWSSRSCSRRPTRRSCWSEVRIWNKLGMNRWTSSGPKCPSWRPSSSSWPILWRTPTTTSSDPRSSSPDPIRLSPCWTPAPRFLPLSFRFNLIRSSSNFNPCLDLDYYYHRFKKNILHHHHHYCDMIDIDDIID